MIIPSQHYQNLSENKKFLKSGWLIFNGPEEVKEPETISVAPVAEEEQKPLETHDFEGHTEEYSTKLEELKKLFKESNEEIDKREQSKLDPIETKFKELKEAHDADITYLKTEYKTKTEELKTKTKETGKHYAPKVNELITKIKSHIEEAKKEKTPKDNAENTEGSEEEQPDSAEKAPEKKEEAGETLSPVSQIKALKIITKLFKITDKGVMDKVNTVISKMKFSKDQILQIEKGNLDLTKEQMGQVIEGATETDLEKPSREEHELIKGLTSWTNLDDYFDDFDDPAFVYLSQKFKITKPEKGEGININGKPITTTNQLIEKFPEPMKGTLTKIEKGEEPDENEMKKMNDSLNTQIKTAEAMMELRGSIVKMTEGMEKTGGALEAFAMLMKLFASIKQAFETGDLDTLGDFLSDWKETKNPEELVKRLNKRLNDSKDAYKKALENPERKPTLSQLIKGYLKPRGPEADAMFKPAGMTNKEFQASPAKKNRIEAKPFIKNYIKEQLGVNSIGSIEEKTNGITEITAYNKKGAPISIELNIDGDKIEGRIIEHTESENKKGEKVWTKPSSDAEFVETDMEKLKDQITGSETEQVATQPKNEVEESQEEKPKPDLYKENDTPPSGEDVRKAIQAAGRYEEFVQAYRVVAKQPRFNAARWQLQWLIENNIPKPKQETA